ncbi:MAG: SGNH/GDSL hydrolase family protein [Vicinamibacteria bacterium]
MKRVLAVTALALCAPLARAQAFQNLASYVALGDSLTAGVVSSSLVVTHQRASFPALIARSAALPAFEQPTVSEPGLPAELVLQSLLPSPVIVPKSATPGAPTNLALPRPYGNLGVPGATAQDMLTRTSDAGGSHDLVLRGLGTAVEQAIALRPSVITLWIGNNDVLGAAVRGRAIDGVTLTPAAAFRSSYEQIVAALKPTGASIVAANLPDVTTIAFVTAISRFATNPATGQPVLIDGQPVPLIGPSGPLPEGSYVLLSASSLLAQGIGVPASLGGKGTPLPDEVVLDPNEVAIVKDRVAADNRAIRDVCGAAGIPVFDFNAFLKRATSEGLNYGGVRLSGAFLSGGLFSYDGVHPTEIGYAAIANGFIDVINANGGSLERVDVGAPLGIRSAAGAALPELSWEALQALLQAFPPLDRP